MIKKQIYQVSINNVELNSQYVFSNLPDNTVGIIADMEASLIGVNLFASINISGLEKYLIHEIYTDGFDSNHDQGNYGERIRNCIILAGNKADFEGKTIGFSSSYTSRGGCHAGVYVLYMSE